MVKRAVPPRVEARAEDDDGGGGPCGATDARGALGRGGSGRVMARRASGQRRDAACAEGRTSSGRHWVSCLRRARNGGARRSGCARSIPTTSLLPRASSALDSSRGRLLSASSYFVWRAVDHPRYASGSASYPYVASAASEGGKGGERRRGRRRSRLALEASSSRKMSFVLCGPCASSRRLTVQTCTHSYLIYGGRVGADGHCSLRRCQRGRSC